MRCSLFFLALGLATAPAPAMALDCSRLRTQADMNQCAQQRYEEADAALNKAYGEVMSRLADDEDARTRLRKAQRAWIAFRDAECAFQAAGTEGGSIHPTLVAGCLTDLTERRSEDLKALGGCREGDTACVLP